MLGIKAINELPTTYEDIKHGKCHESLLRSWNILEKVKYLLRENVPHHITLEIIQDMEVCHKPRPLQQEEDDKADFQEKKR